MFYYMKFRIGVCVPSTCVDSDMESISSALSSSLRLNITIPHCRVKQLQPITNHQLAGGIVFGLVLTTVLVATVMDYMRRKLDKLEQREELVVLRVGGNLTTEKATAGSGGLVNVVVRKCRKSLTSRLDKHWSWLSFSLLTNFKLYFKQESRQKSHQTDVGIMTSSGCHLVNSKSSSLGQQKEPNKSFDPVQQLTSSPATTEPTIIVRCLNGIRVISLCWVIIANSYVTLDPRATKRLTKTRDAPKDFLFQMVAQASLAIETFFFLSGVLMSLSFARKLAPASGGRRESSGKRDGTSDNQTQPQYILKWVHFYVHRYMRMTPATMLVIAFTMFAFRYGDGPLWLEATHKIGRAHV